MASNSHVTSFERALNEFKKDLKKKDQDLFKNTTLDGLKQCIGELQKKQHSSRRLQNLNRLKPFVEAIEQYGKVVTIFANTNEILAFVWGPIKLLLLIAGAYAEAFGELLDTYEHIGEILPLLCQYESLFHQKPHMIRVLSLMYEDILQFHRIALRYFQQPLWRQLFDSTWKTYKSKFGGIISNMSRHRSLIESQASISQIEEFQESRRIEGDRFETHMKNEELFRSRALHGWLKAADVDSDQYHFAKLRADYPETGKWLLKHATFKNWFDPQYPIVPSLLWLNGIPGAGKTILASLAIEETRKLDPRPVVLFFYCKHENPERDNFLVLARSLLAQLLKQDQGLLYYFYQKCCDNADAVLNSPALIEELLTFAFQNCKNAYIILDGLDECPRNERKNIVQWFRTLIDSLPPSEAARYRCLFVSQDDGVARKDFAGLSSIKISVEDNKSDIEEYCKVQAEQLKSDLCLSEEKANSIAGIVMNSVEGMFLLAKLIWINLSGQTSLQALEEELDPQVFPTEIYNAYERIISRIRQQKPDSRQHEAFDLLGWLVCAKRPLRWHEIQGMKAINLDNQTINHEHQKFLVFPKDLCESLVEVRSDDSVELVHLTAKFFLVDRGHVSPPKQEIGLATLCINYLNLPALVDEPNEEKVLRGDYVFMDYATLYWVRHLEASLVQINNNESIMKDLAESLGVFLDQHWTSPNAKFVISKRNSDRLKFFKDYPFYERLEHATVSTRKQLTFFGKMKKDEIALDLADIVTNARTTLEHLLSFPLDNDTKKDISLKYGNNLFKCPRLSCQSFSTGFASSDERERHFGKHERPFRCTEPACPRFTLGFTSEDERKKHVREMHSLQNSEDQEFPTDEEIAQSLQSQTPSFPEVVQEPAAVVVQEPATVVVHDPEPESEPQIFSMQPRSRQRQTNRELRCEYCSKVFTKKYNLTSHLKTHSNDRPYKCGVCGLGFARESDYNRHMSTHSEKLYKCGGTLKDGSLWGCGKPFTRADILSTHHKSKTGQICLTLYLQEQQQDLG